MAADHLEPPAADAPVAAWPARNGSGRVLFLLDAASALEERVLRNWIEEQRPADVAPGDVEALCLPSSRRPRRRKGDALEPALATEDDVLLCPLRIAWLPPVRRGRRAVKLWHALLLGDPRDPGRQRERWVSRRQPDRCQVVVAASATLSELRTRWRTAAGEDMVETAGFDRFVARQAALALERSERRARGARYKVPRFLREDILARPAFQAGLASLAREQGRSVNVVERAGRKALRDIAATHSPLMIDVFAAMSRSSSTRGYDSLNVDAGQVEQVRKLAAQHPLVFLPTHKSNLDNPCLRRVLHDAGMPPNHTAGGDNMNFFPVGPIARRSGIFFIRRSFKEDEVYKFVLRSYIDFLIEKRFPLEWYIEGGRSRSGKMLPPRYGLLSYVVDSYLRGKSDDVILIPVSVAYDQISEVGDYAAEERGAPKQAEGIGWLFRFLSGLGRQYGDISLRFGEPLSLRDALGEPSSAEREEGAERGLAVPKLAFEVCSRINRVTPITPISLAMLALLGNGDRAMSVSELRGPLRDLVGFVERRGLPTTRKLSFDTHDDVCRTFDLLVDSDVVTRFDEGPEVIYSIAPDAHLSAAYYRNTVIHFLVNSAITELALLAASASEPGQGKTVFWDEAMRLRDLMKFDFFFSDKERFGTEIVAELALGDADWEARLDDPSGARSLLENIRPFHAHRALRAFLEAYSIVANRLVTLGEGDAGEDRQLIADCMVWGKQYTLQRRIRSAESVSKQLLQNGLRLARNRGLLDTDSPDLAAQRAAFAEELRMTIRGVDAIDALASARRAGALT